MALGPQLPFIEECAPEAMLECELNFDGKKGLGLDIPLAAG